MKSGILKKLFMVSAVLICLISFAFGAASVEAASLKTAAKKQIAASVKSQYSKVKKYAKSTGYKITQDKKIGKLKKSGKNAYAQNWAMTLKHSDTEAVLTVSFKNTYSKKTEKVGTKIHLDVSFADVKFGKGENPGSIKALKKLMKKCSVKKQFAKYAKPYAKNLDESFGANWIVRCECGGYYNNSNYLSYLIHCLSSRHYYYIKHKRR